MKKLLFTFLLLLIPIQLWSATATVTGRIQYYTNAAFNGQISFQFPFAGAVDTNCTVFTSCFVAPVVRRYPIVNGTITPAPVLTRNGDISPSGTYYRAYLYDSAGNNLMQSSFSIGAGVTTFDIGAALQTTITTNNVSYINPGSLSGNNTWAGNNTFSGLTTFNGTTVFNGPTIFTVPLTLSQVTNISGGTITGTDTLTAPAGGPFAWLLPAGSGTFMDALTATSGSCANGKFNTTTGVLDLSTCAPLASPVFTGDPQAPTPSLGDNDTSIATTAFVHQTNSFFSFSSCTTSGTSGGSVCVSSHALPATQPNTSYELVCTLDSGNPATGGTCSNANGGDPCPLDVSIYNKTTTNFGYSIVLDRGVTTGTGGFGQIDCAVGR
jgi:hypothetical protein